MFKKRLALIVLALFLGICFNLRIGARRISQDVEDCWRTIGQNGIWRCVYFHRSENLANYLSFVNQSIPDNAVVVLPPVDTIPKTLSSYQTMQFFLNTRPVRMCKGGYSNCLSKYQHEDVYLLLVDNGVATAEKLGIEPARIVLHTQSMGLLLPPGELATPSTWARPFNSRLEIVSLLVMPSLLLLYLTAAGYLVVHRLKPAEEPLFKLALGYGLALGCFSLLVFLLMLFNGGFINRFIIFSALFVMGAAAVYLTLNGPRPKSLNWRRLSTGIKIDIWVVLLLIYLALQVLVSLGRAYSSSDDVLIWGNKGYAIAEHGLQEGLQNWGSNTTRYTLNVPVLIAVFRSLFSERLPESKLIFPVFAFMLWLLVYVGLKKKMPAYLAGLSTLLAATVPILYRHANKGYANIIVTYYIVAAFLLYLKLDDDDSQGGKGYPPLLAACLLLAAWSRPEVVHIGAVLTVFLLLRIGPVWRKHDNRAAFIWTTVPYAVFIVVWVPVSHWAYSDSVMDSGLASHVIRDFSQGNFYLWKMGEIFNAMAAYIFDPINWGALGYAILLFVLLLGGWKKGLARYFGFGVIYILMIVLVYYSTLFVDGPRLGWWLTTGLTRLIMPGMVALWVGAVAYSLAGEGSTGAQLPPGA